MPTRRTRLAAALIAVLALSLVAAPRHSPRTATGLAGPLTDKTVTFFCSA